MKQLLLTTAALAFAGIGATLTFAAAPAHAATSCQYLGQNYPVQYDCTQNQPWLPYGTYDNPPLSGPYAGTDCSLPMNQHNMGCTG